MDNFGDYNIKREIKSGGAARIFLAYNKKRKSDVALKIIHDHFLKHSTFKKRLLREARFVSELENPNLIKIYKSGEHEGRAYIEMEYFPSKTLREWIEDRKRITLDEFYKVALQISRGLAALHKKGIVHRDLSFENILINDNLEVKLTDFGLIKILPDNTQFSILTELTDLGTTFGTLPFMSPEQCNGSEVSRPSDIFSLGINFYYMLTKDLPFKGANATSIIASITQDEPDSIRLFNPKVPIDLETLIFSMLYKKRHNRLSDIEEIIQILEFQSITLSEKDSKSDFNVKTIIMILLLLVSTGALTLHFVLKGRPAAADIISDSGESHSSVKNYYIPPAETDKNMDTVGFNSRIALERFDTYSIELVIDGSLPNTDVIKASFLKSVSAIKNKKIYYDPIYTKNDDYCLKIKFSLMKENGKWYFEERWVTDIYNPGFNNRIEIEPKVLFLKPKEIEKTFRNSYIISSNNTII